MTLEDVGDRPAVASHITIQPVCLSGNGVHQEAAGGNRGSVHGIVGRHDGGKVLFLYQCLVGTEIELAHISFVQR